MMLWMAACSPGSLPEGAVDRPDIIVVSVDTLRADHVGIYGHGRPTTPFIDSLARQGTWFPHARSPSPWTLPAHTTLFTGQLPNEHRVIEDGLALPPNTPTFAEIAQDAGYQTGGFVGTIYVSSLFGFERGFDRFEDFGIHTMKVNLQQETTAGDIVDEAMQWARGTRPDEPLLLFLHVYDVHYEYDPPDGFARLFDRSTKTEPAYKNYRYHKKNPPSPEQFVHQRTQYDEAIRYVDAQLQRLATAFEHREVRWIITSDHGEEFGERGSWGHAHTLYAEQLRVPLVLSGSGIETQQRQDIAGLQDIAPTISQWVTGQPGGINLLEPLPKRLFPAETSRFSTNRLGLYTDGLRLEWDLTKDPAQLFDALADPQELHGIQNPGELARLQTAVEEQLGTRYRAEESGSITSDGVIFAQGVRKRFRAEKGSVFAVVPPDAAVFFNKEGGWQAVGGTPPGPGAPVTLLDQAPTSKVELDENTRKHLEALGYLQ